MRAFHRVCWVVSAGGFALVLLAIVADWIGLSAAGSFGAGQILLCIVGLVLVFLGGYPLYAKLESVAQSGQAILALYRGMGIVLLNTLVVLVLLEFFAIVFLKVERSIEEQVPLEVNPRKKEFQPYYLSQDWSKEYWKEYQLSYTKAYQPYLGWSKKSFQGAQINLGSHGVRQTPGTNCQEDSYTILTFGGSSMWGTGSPDWGTIPAYLAEAFRDLKETQVCVVNLGEEAFVSTQGVVRLILQLQSGVKPDLVIFYDGGNDVFAAYQSGRPAVHQNLHSIANRFEGGKNLKEAPLMAWVKSWYLSQLVNRVMPQTNAQRPQLMTFQSMGVDSGVLSDQVVACYLENYRLVQGLAQEYGFEFRFFLQPLIFYGTKPLTELEKQKSRGALNKDKALTELFHSIYGKIQQAAPDYDYLYDLTDVFNDQDTQIWIDYIHVTPVGNKIVAKEMMKTVGMH